MTSSGDDERKVPAANGTIQIDALTDVSLVDDATGSDAPADEPPTTSLPPPLPRTAPAPPSRTGRTIALTLLAAVVGGGLAFAAVHFLFPATTPAPTVAAPPPYTAATSASPHRVTLDEELVIHAGSGSGDDGAEAPQ